MALNLDYVYPKKAEALKAAGQQFVKKNSSEVLCFKNAIILPFRSFKDTDVVAGRGGVVDSQGIYVETSSTYEVKECKFIDKKVVYCGYFNKAWGHFLTEVVSRLWYVLRNDDSIDSYVFIVEEGEDKSFSGNYLEFLKLLGIDNKVEIINKPTKYSEVVVPEDGLVYEEYYTEEFKKMYEYVNKKGLEQYNGPKYDKVFF